MKPFTELTHQGQVRRLRSVAQTMLAQYGLASAQFSLLTHSYNTTFRVQHARGTFMLRVCRLNLHTTQQLRSEVQWLEALRADTDLLVPRPVRNEAGLLVTQGQAEGVPDRRNGVLFEWINGRFCRAPHLTPRHLHRVGVLMAQLHNHVAHQFTPPDGFDRKHAGFAGELKQDFAEAMANDMMTDSQKTFFQEAYSQLQARITAIPRTPQTYNLLHTDLHHYNYMFQGDKAIAIDFDDAAWFYMAYDLAVTLWYLRSHDRYAELREALLAGYTEAGCVIPEHIDLFMQFRTLVMASYVGSDDNPQIRAHAQTYLNRMQESLEEGLHLL